MKLNRMWCCVAVCAALVGSMRVRAADAKDSLKDAGLTKAGDYYVLPDEAAVVDGVKSLRSTKADADKESKARKIVEFQISAKKKVMKDADKEWHELEDRLSLVTDVGIHNRIVTRMNRLVVDHKQAMSDEKDLEEKAGKLPTTAKNQFVDEMLALTPKAEEVEQKYKTLAADAGVKAALAQPPATGAKSALGPSPAFTAAAADLKKWQSEVESEAIPLRDEGGTHLVDVLLNGEHFLMGVDTGASAVSLTPEAATKLNLTPTEKDPVVEVHLADGNVIEGHEMTLKTVRVGRFTVEEVRCIVLSKVSNDAPLLLGGSFLNHFIVKLDPAKDELHLTEIKTEGGQAKVAPHAANNSAGKAKP